jgi:hypothetical protein
MPLRLQTLFRKIAGGRPAYVVPGSLTGTFELLAGRLVGEVTDEIELKVSPIRVYVTRGGKMLLEAATARVGASNSYRFDLAIGDVFSAAELVSEKVQVAARSAAGASGTLRLDGAAALELVREYLGAKIETICDIHFVEGGNSLEFTGAGWSGVEAQSTWTEDDDSYLTLPAISEPGEYALRLTTGAMVSHPVCIGQTVEVFLNGAPIWTQFIAHSHVQFFEIKFAAAGFIGGTLELRLHHPDALRLADHLADGDTRRLALSVKRLALVRFV